MYLTAFNPGTSPVPVSTRGHTIGGSSWGTVETTDDVAKELLENGGLLRLDPDAVPAKDSDSGAVEAMERTAVYASRQETLAGKTKPQVLKIAQAAGLVAADEEPLRDELDVLLVEAVDVELTSPAAASKTTSAPADDKS